jgi:hypothetical protein
MMIEAAGQYRPAALLFIVSGIFPVSAAEPTWAYCLVGVKTISQAPPANAGAAKRLLKSKSLDRRELPGRFGRPSLTVHLGFL